MFMLHVLLTKRVNNYIFKSGLSLFVIPVQPRRTHCGSLLTWGLGSARVLTCNFLHAWTGFNVPLISLLYFKASFGVRRLIGVTEIEKGSSYGNQEFKKKE